MIHCPDCNSTSIIKKGKEFRMGVISQRYKCKSCNYNFYDQVTNIQPISKPTTPKNRTWVITSCLNDSNTNYDFFKSLITYCTENDAELYIVPIKYNADELNCDWDANLVPFFIEENVFLTKNLKLYAGIKQLPTIANPLSGYDSYCKGSSLIIPSPQIMMKTVALSHVDLPAIMYTCGSISHPTYLTSKTGEKANFNHSFAALVIEEDLDIDSFHIRVLNADNDGNFYDLDKYYTQTEVITNNEIPAIVLGDEHVEHIDPTVSNATFYNEDSICKTLNPSCIIRHDVLDFYSASHHHKHDFFTQYKKWYNVSNVVEDEMYKTLTYIDATTPVGSTSVIVESNHNSHLDHWLNSVDVKREPWNAKFYHQLMYLKLENIEEGDNKGAFQLWTEEQDWVSNISFVTNESFKIFDIEVGFHGDKGIHGSRGSSTQFSRLGHKSISGHSHSPSIVCGSYVVGTSSKLKLDYNKGPSSWHHAHCLIQPNGKRQMIFITKGKWRR